MILGKRCVLLMLFLFIVRLVVPLLLLFFFIQSICVCVCVSSDPFRRWTLLQPPELMLLWLSSIQFYSTESVPLSLSLFYFVWFCLLASEYVSSVFDLIMTAVTMGEGGEFALSTLGAKSFVYSVSPAFPILPSVFVSFSHSHSLCPQCRFPLKAVDFVLCCRC